jgi:hypothetical protein
VHRRADDHQGRTSLDGLATISSVTIGDFDDDRLVTQPAPLDSSL